jgi:tetratricopeptide (TPR) repeat protein
LTIDGVRDPAEHPGAKAIAWFVFLFTLAAYTLGCTTSCPFWDSGEFIATSKVLGIPHPPGTPLYVLIGRLFAMVPIGTVAFRVNWLSSLCSALAVLFTFLLTVRFMRLGHSAGGRQRTMVDEVLAWTAGVAAAFFMAFSNTFWDSAIEAEVYSGSSVLQVLILWLGLKWWEGLERKEGDNRLLVAWYLCFLSIGIHLGTFLVLPGLVTLVLLVNWRSLLSPRNFAWALVLAVVGLSVHLYLYYRAHANPPVNEGDPETWKALKALIMREQYGSRPILPRAAPWSFQFAMFFRYFVDQYVLSSKLGVLGGTIPIAIGLFGMAMHAVREKKTFAVMLVTVGITSLGLLVYLNFTDHEVRERDYFYTYAFTFFAIWMGMGLSFLIEWAYEKWPVMQRKKVLGTACGVAVALSLCPLGHYWYTHDRHGFYVARDYAYNMLAPLAKDAFVFTNGDNDTFPLWYIQQGEEIRKDVRVINLSLLNTDWYIRELRDEDPKVPTSITDEQLAQVRDNGYLVDAATGQPEMVNHWMVLDIVKANHNRKPAYIAVTVPDHHGLDSLMVAEGLVLRVYPDTIRARSGYGFTGRNWMDAEKIRHNLYDVFLYRNLFDKDGNYVTRPYKDDNARRLSQNYAAAHQQLAYEYRRQKRFPEAIAELEHVNRMFPDFSPVEGVMGLFILDSGDTAKALQYFEDRAKTHPSSDLYYYWGVALGFLGRTNDAVQKLLKAGDLDPEEVQAYKAAYALLMQANRTQEAANVLQALVEKHPEDPEVQAYLGQADSTRHRWTGDRPASP